MIHVVWFKKDLRVHDHAPLYHAFQSGGPILPLYIFEPDYWTLPDTSKRHWSFIKDSLIDLQQQLKNLGLDLIFKVGSVDKIMTALKQEHKDLKIYSHEETGNMWTYTRDISLRKWAKDNNVVWQEFPNNGVVRRLQNRDQWSSIHKQRMTMPQLCIQSPSPSLVNVSSDSMPDMDSKFFKSESIESVQPGRRKNGLKILESFLKTRSINYMKSISKSGPAYHDCSRLSPHITYGTLSVREIFHACWQQIKDDKDNNVSYKAKNITAMISRLYWHCHFIQKLEDAPEIEFACMHNGYESLRDSKVSGPHIESWSQGNTGFPLIDASMRCLHQTGWLNFRMRAMVVSFAAYHLWIDWRILSPILARLFTDYEPGIHYSQLQMQSGVTGINAIRIYNPIKQSYDNDAKGVFIKKYIPELKNVSSQWIHEPWKMPNSLQENYGCIIGTDYPAPIVDHEAAGKEARKRLADYRKSRDLRQQTQKVFQKHGSRKTNRPKKSKSNPQLNLF